MKTMKISKPLSIILLLVMILSLMPAYAWAEENGEDAASSLSSAGDPIVINEISATVTAPVTGKAPKDMSASAPEGANYTVKFFRCCYETGPVMPNDESFKPGTRYDVDVLVTANSGYKISKTASMQVNGDKSISPYRSGTMGNDIMYSMDFYTDTDTATPPDPPINVIDNMAASITFPVAGQCPSDTLVSAPDDANYTVEFLRCRYLFDKLDTEVNDICWDVPMNEPLEADKNYSVDVLVGAKPGYKISEEAVLRVNGDWNIYFGPIATRDDGDKIVYATNYTAKAPVATINRIVTTVNRPVAGGNPTDVQVLVDDNLPYTGEVMAWSVGDSYLNSDAMSGNFEAGKTYWANIKFDVKTGSNSKFANSIDIIVESDGVEKNTVHPDGSYAEIVLKFVIPASKTVDIHVNKVWQNENGERIDWPDGQIVDVVLLKNGEPSDIKARIVDDTGTDFLSFPKFDPTGREIEYTVDEVNVPNGYTHEVTLDTTGNFIITNTKTPESADYATIIVRKEWKDGAGNAITPPVDSVEVEILNGEEIVEAFSVSERNQWTNSMNLPAKDSNGNPINYTVKEANVPAGFESVVSGTLQDGFTITNTKKSEPADYATIIVRKEWKDGAGNAITPPVDSVGVEILNGEEIIEAFSVSERNQWTNSMNLPAKDSNGNPINYTVKEANVPAGFESVVSGTLQDGFTITNIQEHRYLLHYDANGGKNPPVDNSETNALGFAEMYVSSDKPTKKDMVFTGWATSKDGKAVYHAGDKITLTLDNDSITLYAAWAKPTDKPKTGDESNVLLWTSLAIASLAGCAALFAYSKKRHKA